VTVLVVDVVEAEGGTDDEITVAHNVLQEER